MQKKCKIKNLYRSLRKKHGQPKGQWSLWRKRPKTKLEKEEILIGAILTQQTNWNNVASAIKNLKSKNLCSLKNIYDNFVYVRNKHNCSLQELRDLIRPSGFYNQKTGYLLNIAKFIIERYGSLRKMEKAPLGELREELLRIKGIGKETADSILLYALEKEIFVIDEYTKRFCKKNNLSQNFSYQCLQELFQADLPVDYKLYQDYHALIVIDGKIKND
ncbi:MAG: endonuclease [bacterium]